MSAKRQVNVSTVQVAATSEPPEVWGRRIWTEIHRMSLRLYRGVLVCDFVQYLESLKTSLPCHVCREHYIEMLKDNPITPHDLQSARNAFAYTHRLHNIVNRRLGKKEISFEDALRLY